MNPMILPRALAKVLADMPDEWRAYIVGGSVRDHLLGLKPKDFDVEVFNVQADVLAHYLHNYGDVDQVGVSFGIIKVNLEDGEVYDFSIPRTEQKVGSKHTDFDVVVNPHLSIAAAASRRDFTINAIYYEPRNPTTGYLDPFGGLTDLQQERLHHCGPAFAEDPLRVLRGMQFVSRFGFRWSDPLLGMAASLEGSYPTISGDRVWTEFAKWAEKSIAPELGIQFLIESGWIRNFPELNAIIGIRQSPTYHPEGDVMQHTLECLKALRRVAPDLAGERKIIITLAILCHDLGKATHTQYHEDGKITSHGHEKAGEAPTESFLNSINCPHHIRDQVVKLVGAHMLQIGEINANVLRRASVRIQPSNLSDLCIVMECDKRGRPPLPDVRPAKIDAIYQMISELKIGEKKPEPILLGRHLIEAGIKPGKQMGEILKFAYEAQLDGHFSDLETGLVHVLNAFNLHPVLVGVLVPNSNQ